MKPGTKEPSDQLDAQIVESKKYVPITPESHCQIYPSVVKTGNAELLALWAETAYKMLSKQY